MAKTKSVSGLTTPQIDAITLEICHVEALAIMARRGTGDGIYISLFAVMGERLAKIKEMVCDCQIGGRRG
jgi:hypothetical protein